MADGGNMANAGIRHSVLVVDDEPQVLRAIEDTLEDSFRVYAETSPEAAIELIRKLPDLEVILSDQRMPGISGDEFLARAREMSNATRLMITGYADLEAVIRAVNLGKIFGYVSKPWNPDHLKLAVFKAAEHYVLLKDLATERELLRQLMDNTPDAIFFKDLEHRFIRTNRAHAQFWGLARPEDALGKTHWDLFPGDRARIRDAEEKEIFRTGTPLTDSVHQLKLPAGELKWLSTTKAPIRDAQAHIAGLVGVSRDVTERRLALEALRESEERFRQLAESIREVFFLLDAETLHTIYVSPAFEEVWGQSAQALYENPLAWSEAIHPEDRERVVSNLPRARESGRFDNTYRIVRPDGAVRWIHARGFPITDASGKIYRIAGISDDITERKAHEERIARLTRTYAVLSDINSLIVRARNRDELFREACRIAVEDGAFALAWIGVVDAQAMQIVPVSWFGAGEEYLKLMPLGIAEGTPETYGLAGRAVREKKAIIANDMPNDPMVLLRKQAEGHGFLSVVVLPLAVSGEVVGVLSLYARTRGFFDEEEMRLLEELAGDLSFALDHLEKEQRLNYLAYFDPLTGLANRSLFHERLSQHVETAAREAQKVGVVMVDVERFKSINDSLGRHAADQLLKQIAERMIHYSGDPSRHARIGGNQFAVVVPNLATEDELARRVERRQSEIYGSPFRLGDTDLRVSVRSGIALYPGDGKDADILLQNAEAALKKAKASGEHYVFYAPQMSARVAEKLSLENKLRQALEKEEFVLHYQPKFNLADQRLAGLEALIRWNSPELGLVPPMQFIPLLEETGLILEVGTWAFERAALDHRKWAEQGIAAPRIAVNVSAIQVRRRDFVDIVRNAVARGAAVPGIDLEITESLIMEDIAGNVERLQAIKEFGVNIAIDDFGTGYSSLGYLARLPIHSLKVDRSFIDRMSTDPDSMTIVSTVISLAHSFNYAVCAEGVETEEQARLLRLLKCDQAQGYYFGRPVPAEEIERTLKAG